MLIKRSGEHWRYSDHTAFQHRAAAFGKHADRIVVTLHGTSVVMTERTYAKFITDHSNALSRRECSTPPDRSARMTRLEGADVTHGSGRTALITIASAEWVLLSVVYHYVLAQSPSPEAAKITISTAWRNGQLRLRADVREHEARPDLTLRPGEQPPQVQPKREADQPILASDEFGTWDWERSYATRRDATTRSLFECMDIVASRDDVLRLWPPAEVTATLMTETSKTAVTKPNDVSSLVWAVVLTLDDIEKQAPSGLAGLIQEQLTAQVSVRLSRRVSRRTVQKAVALRRKRNGSH